MNAPLSPEMCDTFPFVADDAFCAEEMLNGQRLLVSKYGSLVRAFSRDRTVHDLPLPVVTLARSFAGDFVLEGELVRESFFAFDLIEACQVNVASEAFVLRRKLLALVSPFPLVAHATGERGKTRLLESLREACGDGIVFKRLGVPYDPGHDIYAIRFNNYRTDPPQTSNYSIENWRVDLSAVHAA
jgi:ATP-dependent DNA ligase